MVCPAAIRNMEYASASIYRIRYMCMGIAEDAGLSEQLVSVAFFHGGASGLF
jgi:hypothetical protein